MKIMSPIEIVDRQTAIVKLQADIINELFRLLSQHISAEELDALPVIDKINLAAQMLPEEREE